MYVCFRGGHAIFLLEQNGVTHFSSSSPGRTATPVRACVRAWFDKYTFLVVCTRAPRVWWLWCVRVSTS